MGVEQRSNLGARYDIHGSELERVREGSKGVSRLGQPTQRWSLVPGVSIRVVHVESHSSTPSPENHQPPAEPRSSQP